MKTKKHKVKINDLSKLGSVLSISAPTQFEKEMDKNFKGDGIDYGDKYIKR